MREIVLDTETTGLDPREHRLVEIGCIELANHLPSGQIFHRYVNPERDIPREAFAIHGLSREFLEKHPVFSDIADAFLEFIGDAPLIIHNAEFDMRFLNAELGRMGRPPLPFARAIDTVTMARKRFPGSPANLDALCRRFGIDNSARDKHGALLDSELLAEVYLELIGGREPGLTFGGAGKSGMNGATPGQSRETFLAPRPHAPTEEETRAWEGFLKSLKSPIWLN